MQNFLDWLAYGPKRTIYAFMSADLIPTHKRLRTPMTRGYLDKLIEYAVSREYPARLIRSLKDGRVKAIEEVGTFYLRFQDRFSD